MTAVNGAAPVSEIEFREFDSRAEASQALADELAWVLTEALNRKDSAALVVSGGSTPAPMFSILRELDVTWQLVTVVPSDEREVEPDHPDRNEAMIRRELLAGPAADARLVSLIPPGEIPGAFDAVVLGMGDDGHTASLFPATSQLKERKRSVVATTSPFAPYQRISLTVPAINRARTVCLLVTGSEKASRLAEVLQQINAGHPELPSSLVQPTSGQLLWLIDDRAAAQL